MTAPQHDSVRLMKTVIAPARRQAGIPQYLVAQIGARMHYAVPRILEQERWLARLYTDICAAKGWPWLLRSLPTSCRPVGLQRLLGRLPVGVPSKKIHAFTSFGWSYVRALAAA